MKELASCLQSSNTPPSGKQQGWRGARHPAYAHTHTHMHVHAVLVPASWVNTNLLLPLFPALSAVGCLCARLAHLDTLTPQDVHGRTCSCGMGGSKVGGSAAAASGADSHSHSRALRWPVLVLASSSFHLFSAPLPLQLPSFSSFIPAGPSLGCFPLRQGFIQPVDWRQRLVPPRAGDVH